ncbi:MAG: hypothetical protein LW832_08975 [Parachlamydia sp.]|nr:hypothetical protein [Parachlamydia sp.]
MNHFLELLLALAFVAGVCFFLLKVIQPLALNVFDLTLTSPLFRFATCLFLAIAFFTGGIFQISDVLQDRSPSMAWVFPFTFLASGFFVFAAFYRSEK